MDILAVPLVSGAVVGAVSTNSDTRQASEIHANVSQELAPVGPYFTPSGQLHSQKKRKDVVSRQSASASLQARSGNAIDISGRPARTSISALPNFPANVPVSRERYENWSGEIKCNDVLTCTPSRLEDVENVVNWALQNGYTRVRPLGMSHNWSPLTLAAGTDGLVSKVLLVRTTSLKAISVDSESKTATAQCGITMEAFLTALEEANLGMIATPGPGDLTLGGVLAIGGHGTGVPVDGEVTSDGHTYASLSNSILSLTALVWSDAEQKYAMRTFKRSEQDCRAFLVHVGRAFILEVTMQAGPNQNLRCRSYDDIPATEIFAAPGDRGRTFEMFMNRDGRVEAI